MNMQQMIQQAQRMQAKLRKAQAALEQEEFSITKGGAVTVKMLGSKRITAIEIDDDAFDVENKEMVVAMITLAVNELIDQIQEKSDKIQEEITGQAGGLGF